MKIIDLVRMIGIAERSGVVIIRGVGNNSVILKPIPNPYRRKILSGR